MMFIAACCRYFPPTFRLSLLGIYIYIYPDGFSKKIWLQPAEVNYLKKVVFSRLKSNFSKNLSSAGWSQLFAKELEIKAARPQQPSGYIYIYMNLYQHVDVYVCAFVCVRAVCLFSYMHMISCHPFGISRPEPSQIYSRNWCAFSGERQAEGHQPRSRRAPLAVSQSSHGFAPKPFFFRKNFRLSLTTFVFVTF